jgi:hypothetical protein
VHVACPRKYRRDKQSARDCKDGDKYRGKGGIVYVPFSNADQYQRKHIKNRRNVLRRIAAINPSKIFVALLLDFLFAI